LPVRGSAELAGRFHLLLRETRDPARALARARREAYDAGNAWSVPVLLQHARVPPPPERPPELFGLPRPGLTWRTRPEYERRVVAALRAHRLVAVVGLPGIGKTQVADRPRVACCARAWP
jgi:hypothetical protein